MAAIVGQINVADGLLEALQISAAIAVRSKPRYYCLRSAGISMLLPGIDENLRPQATGLATNTGAVCDLGSNSFCPLVRRAAVQVLRLLSPPRGTQTVTGLTICNFSNLGAIWS
jgi:hypothetical protein